jgi:hypothetical protein
LQLTIDIAETTRFGLFGVMETTSPIDGDITLVSRQSRCALCVISSHPSLDEVLHSPIDPPADMEQYSNSPSNIGQSSPTLSARQLYSAIQSETLTSDLLSCELMCVFGVYTMQEIDVFIRVEL